MPDWVPDTFLYIFFSAFEKDGGGGGLTMEKKEGGQMKRKLGLPASPRIFSHPYIEDFPHPTTGEKEGKGYRLAPSIQVRDNVAI